MPQVTRQFSRAGFGLIQTQTHSQTQIANSITRRVRSVRNWIWDWVWAWIWISLMDQPEA